MNDVTVEPIEAIIQMENIYFDEIHYSYKIENDDGQEKYKMNFTRELASEGEPYGLRLSCHIFDDCQATDIKIRLVAYFKCNLEDTKEIEDLLKVNAVAIVFPYLRSQISLLTTQPGKKPILLNAMNIIEMFKD